jgi:hypothetical protein
MENAVLKRMEFEGIDTEPFRPIWDRVTKARREPGRVPAPTPASTIWTLRQRMHQLTATDPHRALEVAREVNALIEGNRRLARERSEANSRVRAATLAAVIETRRLLMEEVEAIGGDINAIAAANLDLCRSVPDALPVEIVHLYNRWRAINGVLSETSLAVPPDTKGYRPARDVLWFVREDLRPGVAARCRVTNPGVPLVMQNVPTLAAAVTAAADAEVARVFGNRRDR